MTMYAVAVRDQTLILFLRVRRAPSGDVYAIDSLANHHESNSHASLHASGRHHFKGHGFIELARDRPKPDQNLRGSVNVVTRPLAASEIGRLYRQTCVASEFDAVLEVPIHEIGAEKYTTHVSVDVGEPGVPALIPVGARVIAQLTVGKVSPCILITAFDTKGALGTGSPTEK